jgi:hypothetical protein
MLLLALMMPCHYYDAIDMMFAIIIDAIILRYARHDIIAITLPLLPLFIYFSLLLPFHIAAMLMPLF